MFVLKGIRFRLNVLKYSGRLQLYPVSHEIISLFKQGNKSSKKTTLYFFLLYKCFHQTI